MKINKSKANLQNGVDTSVCFDKGMPNCTCGSAKRRNEISTAVAYRWFDKPKNVFDLFNIFFNLWPAFRLMRLPFNSSDRNVLFGN